MVKASPLDMAKTVLGFSEGKDRAALTDYLKTGGQNIDPATRAWCAAFVNASLQKAGYSGTGSDLARSFLEWGNAVEPGNIQPGDVGVYARGADPMYGHTGIVESYDPRTGTVKMISGNAGAQGSVEEGTYSTKEALGFRRAVDAQMQAAGYTPEQRRNAIGAIESAGSGDYKALGPVTNRQGNRAYGRYQVMASNIPAWTKQALGTEMTPEQFLADPQAQDKVFDTIFGGYAQQHGERGAASMWFTGQPNEPDVKDVLGTTGKGYVDRYMKALGATPSAQHPPNPTVGTGGYTAPGANVTPVPATTSTAKTDSKDKYATAISGGLKGMAALKAPVMGAQGGAPQLPGIAPTALESVPITAPGADDARRNQLALLMQRLNAGSLWG